MTEDRIFSFISDTPLGKIYAAAGSGSLIGLWFIGQKYFPISTDAWIENSDYSVFKSLGIWLDAYFSGKKPKTNFSLSPRGTNFQKAVWNILLEIPYGKTTSYGAITAKLISAGIKASAQAVGGAVGHNPISLIIPCHRVLGADGSLTGYAGGLEKKQALLELECPSAGLPY